MHRAGQDRLRALELQPLWFPLLDPLLFRLPGCAAALGPRLLSLTRWPRVRIPGYFSLEVIVQK